MYQVVSFRKNGSETLSKPLNWDAAYAMWYRKNSRSPKRYSIRKAV